MTGCVEVYTEVNYYSEYGQSQENQWTGKFVLHIFDFSFIWLPIGSQNPRPAWTVPGQRSRAAIKPKRKLFYLMTLSASMFGEIVRPICFTVFKLITNSNLVGYSKGGETDRDTALAGRLLSKVPHNAIDRCLTRAGQEQHQRACQ